jgi:hypothetical protein
MFLEGPAEVLVDQLVDKLQPEVDRTLGSHPASVPMCGGRPSSAGSRCTKLDSDQSREEEEQWLVLRPYQCPTAH